MAVTGTSRHTREGSKRGQAHSQAAGEASVQEVRAAGKGAVRQGQEAKAKKESGNYPIPDKDHAISAKSLSRKQRKDGNLTKDEFERINRKADKVLAGDN